MDSRLAGALRFLAGSCLAFFLLSYSCRASSYQAIVKYYYADPQGTVVAETDAQGVVLERYDYTPYGRPVSGGAASGPGFAGHTADPETGLLYMQARYYDPEVGRFLSVDVYKAKAGDVFSSNLYVYAHAAPSVLVDPDGRQAKGGRDLDICNGPVPCGSVTYGRNGNISGPYEKIVDRVFTNYHVSSDGKSASLAPFPAEVRTALIYIIASPLGRAVVKASLEHNESITLMDMTATSMAPNFYYAAGQDAILYTTRLADFKASYMNDPIKFAEVRDQTLDVILMHEIGHTPLGRTALGIIAQPHTNEDEFEDVRKVENPYRGYYGIPARTTYSGMSISE